MEQTEFLLSIKQDLLDLKTLLTSGVSKNIITDKWIPRRAVMDFFHYGPTQMASFEKDEDLIVARVGKRKFIRRDSLEKILNRNIIK